jgi:nitrogen fixation protein NifB
VVGVAGPGDTLATEHALATFALVHRRFPNLIKCLSTNGLLLREKADQILDAGVSAITVTVNAVEPGVLQQICTRIAQGGRVTRGESAARILIAAQLAGIEELARRGALVKINTVLVPGVNDGQVDDIARCCAAAGAAMLNIIPLIPQHDMIALRAPDCHDVNRAREAAQRHLPVFRHCRQCRADACGIPGTGVDFADELYDGPSATFSHG